MLIKYFKEDHIHIIYCKLLNIYGYGITLFEAIKSFIIILILLIRNKQ